MAKLLIQYGTDINNKDIHDRNVIYDALSYGDINFINYLLNMEELDRNLVDEDENSVMQHPEVLKNSAIAKTLINHGVDPTTIPKNKIPYILKIIVETKEDIIDILDTAIDNNVDMNTELPNGNTILLEVIATISSLHRKDDKKRDILLKAAKKMLDAGGDINAHFNNETGIFQAIRDRDYEIK